MAYKGPWNDRDYLDKIYDEKYAQVLRKEANFVKTYGVVRSPRVADNHPNEQQKSKGGRDEG